MVSSNEVGFDLREIVPLPRNILQDCRVTTYGYTGQRASRMASFVPNGYRYWIVDVSGTKVVSGNLKYPDTARDSAKSGLGHKDNHHLNYLVESISVNVGGPRQGAKASSPPI